jgi:SHS family lactate transporter-like MFS transporter
MDIAAPTGALVVAESYTPRETRATLVFAFLGTVFDGVELNLLSYPLVYLARSLHVGTASIVGAVTAQGVASLVGGFAFGWLGDVLGQALLRGAIGGVRSTNLTNLLGVSQR